MPPRRLVLFIGLMSILGGCAPMSYLITPVPADRELDEFVVQRDSIWATNRIAIIEVEGVLRNGRSQSVLGPAGDNPVVVFQEKLDKAADDDRVKAVVLRINSPGGGVTASDLMYGEVNRFRHQTGKPVIACMLDVAASGGYYIACAADEIIALPTTVTGSIGVIMIAPDFSGTMVKLGIAANVIKSGEMKDAGSPFRAMRDEDRALFQNMIDTMYERFVGVVVESRHDMESDRVRELADGRVYLGTEAQRNGLVDKIGTLHDAIDEAKAAAGLEDEAVVVVQYAQSHAHRPNIYAESPSPPAQVNMVNVSLPSWLSGSSPEFLYLWAPGW